MNNDFYHHLEAIESEVTCTLWWVSYLLPGLATENYGVS